MTAVLVDLPAPPDPTPPAARLISRAEALDKLAKAIEERQILHKGALARREKQARAFALAAAQERSIRGELEQLERTVRSILGLPTKGVRDPIKWDEIQCPKCDHRFIPSKFGNGESDA